MTFGCPTGITLPIPTDWGVTHPPKVPAPPPGQGG